MAHQSGVKGQFYCVYYMTLNENFEAQRVSKNEKIEGKWLHSSNHEVFTFKKNVLKVTK